MIRALVFAVLVLASASIALAGTKMATNLGTPAPVCDAGACNNGKAVTCSTDSDCDVGILLPSSKWAMDGKFLIKGTVKKVTPAGSSDLVTTDGTLGSPDDYIFAVCIRAYVDPPGSTDRCIYVHVDLKNGNGKIALNAAPVATSLGLSSVTVQLVRAIFYAPPSDPSMCPGNNDTTSPSFLTNQVSPGSKAACETGGAVGVGGVVTGF